MNPFYLFIQIDELFIRELEGLNGSENGVPVAVVDVCHEGILRIDRVERHRSLLLQSLQRVMQIILLQILLDQTDDAGK